MNRIELNPWMDYEESNAKEIYRVSNQICSIVKKLNKFGVSIIIEVDNETLLYNINIVISYWTKHTYVGKRKNDTIRTAFQSFFVNLYELLIFFKYNSCDYYSELANNSLYQGRLYRYLGHGHANEDIQRKILPEYDEIYVSWSKKSPSLYLEQKLYGTITILSCVVDNPYWAIDLKQLGAVCEGEDEAVFPTISETVKEIKFIER